MHCLTQRIASQYYNNDNLYSLRKLQSQYLVFTEVLTHYTDKIIKKLRPSQKDLTIKIQIKTTGYVTLRDMQRKYKTIGSLTIISLSATFTNTLTHQMLIVGSKHNNATL